MAYLRREHKRNPGKILDSGMTPAETLAAASVEAHRLIHEQYDLFNNELQPALSREGIHFTAAATGRRNSAPG